ncbi:recombinase family protein [Pseudoxanthomonas helianthi]|uniref:Recombinase family protein n=1 Tax=Pseudoxanthomonas helianthi TaxID=1453541 RepID=A0A940X5F8_9GAMM|nr:recombinase family protein [Pseudoxanthomonas helianthi]MBP3984784.1 recombinase family protein [Pseudoxanthomonas helianthi]
MHGKFVAYYRVSTKRQGESGLGLEAQRQAVLDYLNGGKWELLAEYTDVESGGDDSRPELARAIDHAKKAKATLVIAKLDRLSRKVSFVSSLMDSGVRFVAADNPSANELTINILAAVAQEERRLISQRTKAALVAAKKRGVRLGNPRLDDARTAAQEAREQGADRFATNVIPVIRQVQAAGCTGLREIAAALDARGIKTRRGSNWTAAAVSRVLSRA